MATKLPKRIRSAREAVERTKLYSIADAVKLVKENAKAKFDETIDVAAAPFQRVGPGQWRVGAGQREQAPRLHSPA